MGVLLLLAVLLCGGLVAGVAFVAVVLRACLWLVLLPFRLLVGVLAIPLLAVKFVFLSVGAVLAVLAACAGLVFLIGLSVAAAASLFPIACLALVPWAIVRLVNRPSVLRS